MTLLEIIIATLAILAAFAAFAALGVMAWLHFSACGSRPWDESYPVRRRPEGM
jgi:hypothetical protein